MGQLLTLAEIEPQFDSEWVLLEDPQTTEQFEVNGGRVYFHSKDRDEVYRKARELPPRAFAVLYTGTLPKDAAILL